MDFETCAICGGDGRVSNAFGGSSVTCPSCHGSGRRNEAPLLRDVTKTKPSHYRSAQQNADKKEPEAMTGEGRQLSLEVQKSAVADAIKTKLLREIVEYEGSHGRCTETFAKKIRKQIR